MSPEVLFIIRYLVFPVIGVVVGLIVYLYRRDLENHKAELQKEKGDREIALIKLTDDTREKIYHNQQNIGKLFTMIDELEKCINEVKKLLAVQTERCKITHTWDGKERRNRN